MKALLLLLPLAACAPPTWTAEQAPCHDVDLQDDVPELRLERDGDDLVITRTMDEQGDHDDFGPNVAIEHGTVFVHEAWTADAASTSTLCWFASVRASPAPSRKLDVEWYTEDDDVVPAFVDTWKP